MTGSQPAIVDLDDTGTWPLPFREVVHDFASSPEVDELFRPDVEVAALDALVGYRLRAYHCTRLTEREQEWILRKGLQPLSHELIASRLRAAVDDGYLTPEEAAFYGKTRQAYNVSRKGKVWSFTERASLSDAPKVGYLLENWGGEGINMSIPSRSCEMKRLERVGTPSVVVLGLDLSIHYARGHPGILEGAVQRLRRSRGGTEIVTLSAIEPDYIEAIEQPDSAFWQRFCWTPKGGFKQARRTD